MSDATHTGGCTCGAVRYRARGEPALALVCHCTFCQRRSGSAFATITYFAENAVEFTGELTEYEHRSDASGRWIRTRFCPRCGATVTHAAELRPGLRAIAAGTFDDPNWFTLQRHIWVQSKQPWVTIPAGVAVFERGSADVSRS